jgi:hypothetical protein
VQEKLNNNICLVCTQAAGYNSESMDLFRHCTFLGPESESALGYSNWILATLAALEEEGARSAAVEPHNRYILEHMHGVTVAADSLTAYCARQPDSSVAQVLQIMNGRGGNKRTVLRDFLSSYGTPMLRIRIRVFFGLLRIR